MNEEERKITKEGDLSFEYPMHAIIEIEESRFLEAAVRQGLSVEDLRANQAQIAGYVSKDPESENGMLLVTLLDKEGKPVGKRNIKIAPKTEHKG